MGNDDGCPVLGGSVERFLNHTFRVRVKSTGRFVEEKNLRVRYETPSNGNTLLLSAGEETAPLSNPRVVPLREADDKIVCKGELSSVFDASSLLLLRGCLPRCPDEAIRDVLEYGAVEENRFLDADSIVSDLAMCEGRDMGRGPPTCCTRRTLVRSQLRFKSLTSLPSNLTVPAVASYQRSKSPMMVLLPDPLGPCACQS